MEHVNNRFIEFYESLLKRGVIKNATDFANKVDVSSSLMTEIMKKRSNIGTKIIQNTVLNFELNVDWLFTGIGSMLKNPALMDISEMDQHDKEVAQGKWHHHSNSEKDVTTFDLYNNRIISLENEIVALKTRIAELIERLAEQKETITTQRELIDMLKKQPQN